MTAPKQPASVTANAVVFLTTSPELRFGDGFHEEEHDGVDTFRWMSRRGQVAFEASPHERFLELWLFCEFADLSQRLRFESDGQADELELVHGWAPVSVSVPAGSEGMTLQASRVFPAELHSGDLRDLALRVRLVRLHADADRHAAVHRQWANAALNTRELLAGRTALESTPPKLGIDLHGACNVKPPCVYCEWDYAKRKEGKNVSVPFTLETLEEHGEFFENAMSLVNCSIGEPFMMRGFDDVLAAIGDRGKSLEMSTNGQILTDRNIERLLGRNVELYVSLDAATPLTYARLRNDSFPRILDNLRRLVAAKRASQGLPKVYLVFMPMKVNAHELPDFVRLCADLGVDKLILRPLNPTPGNDLVWDRAGYRFSYDDELLPLDEQLRLAERAAGLCRELGVDLANQLDFGGAAQGPVPDEESAASRSRTQAVERPTETPDAPATAPNVPEPEPEALPSLGFERLPVCSEPWQSLYILRRGLRPCCYGGDPVGPMNGFRDAWNAPLLQGIRASLRQGVFHDYCLRSPACPIVEKARHAGVAVPRGGWKVRAWRAWVLLNRATGGVPRRVLGRLRGRALSGT